tara:strand:+ start:9577 stop:10698 length:1122 start_codon:yes stop_codon:yes gene_type:complete
VEEAEREPTVREAITDAIAEHTQPAPDAPVVESTQAAEAPEPKQGRTTGRLRDERGKLLPGKAQRDAAPESPKPADPSPAKEAQPTTPVAAPAPAIQRPSAWKKEMWPVWDKLNAGTPLSPQEARQVAEYNSQREQQFANGVSTYKQIAESAKPIMDAIAPFQGDLDKYGAQAPQMIHSLMSAHRSLALGSPHEKLQLLNKLANDYGIPIQALYDQNAQNQFLAQPHQAQQAPQQQSPDIAALVRQELTNTKIQETVESMRSNRTEYPFFEYLRPTMAQLLESGQAEDLNDAYAKALDAPEHEMLTTVQQAQQAQMTEQSRIATAQATVRAAKANTVSTRSATPAGEGAPKGNPSVREALKAAMAQHRSGSRV